MAQDLEIFPSILTICIFNKSCHSSLINFIYNSFLTFFFFSQADIIVWDYERKEAYAKFSLHKVKVESLAFSPNDLYLVTLGGQDDGT